MLCFRFQTGKSSNSKIKENLLIIQIHAFRIKIPGGGEYRPIWPLRGCAAGQGMIFDLSLLNRVYNFV